MNKTKRKAQKLIRSDRFIFERLNRPDLFRLIVEMGPNCNLACYHCGIESGPDRKEMPDAEIVGKALSDSVRMGLDVTLTHGEPLREEFKDILRLAGNYASKLPVLVMTNGTFAIPDNGAEEWAEFLQEAGFGREKGRDRFSLSFGPMYPTRPEHYASIFQAFKKHFPERDIGKFLGFRHVSLGISGHLKEDRARINGLVKEMYRAFGVRRSDYIAGMNTPDPVGHFYPKSGSPLRIAIDECFPIGRARNLPGLDKKFPEKDIRPEELHAFPENAQSAVLLYNGDIGLSVCCEAQRYVTWGNVKTESLQSIFSKIREDPFFIAQKLYGTPLIYFAAQQVSPGFSVRGRVSHDVLDAIYRNERLVDDIRKYLAKEGVEETFEDFLDSVHNRK